MAMKVVVVVVQVVHSRKPTWKPKKGPIKTTVLLKGGYMGFHVSLRECIAVVVVVVVVAAVAVVAAALVSVLPRFPSNPLIIRVPFFLLSSFNEDTPI